MEHTHHISSDWLSIEKIAEIVESKAKLELSGVAREKVVKCRQYLDDKMSEPGKVF